MTIFSLEQRILVLCVLLLLFFIPAANAAVDSSDAAVKNVYYEWCSAIHTAKGHADQIIKFYAPDAILIPTLSSDFLINKDNGLVAYFTMLANLPNIKCTPDKLVTHVHDGIATNIGLYHFSFEENGKTVNLPARFTFVYKDINGKWMIISHHSSKMP